MYVNFVVNPPVHPASWLQRTHKPTHMTILWSKWGWSLCTSPVQAKQPLEFSPPFYNSCKESIHIRIWNKIKDKSRLIPQKSMRAPRCPNLFWKLAPKHPDDLKMLYSYDPWLREFVKWEMHMWRRRRGQGTSNYK